MPRLTTDAFHVAVLEHLRRGPDSISGLARALSEGREKPVHRLTVAGYLQALADVGVLRELDRPPSKLYQLAHPDLRFSLHQRLGRAAQEAGVDAERRAAVLATALEAIFHRPVFRAEIIHAGHEGPWAGVEEVEVADQERRDLRALFQKRSAHPLDIPRGDPLLRPQRASLHTTEAESLLRRVLRETTASDHLAVKRPKRQSALDGLL